ncbi:MAG TPA: 3-methyl-2-oxobutanoate hydroxymethyltransferase [Bacteroidales bacterium]|nr:3-methyl-2-oxobutanoate hydroxymethyltransferase [Bacteroidales bacterium]
MNKRITTRVLQEMKHAGTKIAMITAYDFPSAKVVEEAGADIILVGDSLGMVILGYENTIPVTIGDMVHHGRAVVRASKRALVVIDMPFMTYQISTEEAMRNAAILLQETGATVVKLEGGSEIAPTVQRIVAAGIPVMGHIGLTPQHVGKFGGFAVQGQEAIQALKLVEDALALQDAGACAVVLEAIPWQVAQIITQRLTIPTIGIGAGIHCDGQVLVYHDILGLQTEIKPKFVKQYGNFFPQMAQAVGNFVAEVKEKSFPDDKRTYSMEENALRIFNEKTN